MSGENYSACGEVQALLEQAEQTDAQDEPELDVPGEVARRADRMAGIKRAKEEIKKRAQARFAEEQAEHEQKLRRRQEKEEETGRRMGGRAPQAPQAGPRDKDQVNFTDEESRIMPSSEGFVQAYNAQAAVEIETHLIVTNHLTQQANDKLEVVPTLQKLAAVAPQLGEAAGLLADADYFSKDSVAHCEQAEVTPYISDH